MTKVSKLASKARRAWNLDCMVATLEHGPNNLPHSLTYIHTCLFGKRCDQNARASIILDECRIATCRHRLRSDMARQSTKGLIEVCGVTRQSRQRVTERRQLHRVKSVALADYLHDVLGIPPIYLLALSKYCKVFTRSFTVFIPCISLTDINRACALDSALQVTSSTRGT